MKIDLASKILYSTYFKIILVHYDREGGDIKLCADDVLHLVLCTRMQQLLHTGIIQVLWKKKRRNLLAGFGNLHILMLLKILKPRGYLIEFSPKWDCLMNTYWDQFYF